jgi:hypothetical protein
MLFPFPRTQIVVTIVPIPFAIMLFNASHNLYKFTWLDRLSILNIWLIFLLLFQSIRLIDPTQLSPSP